MGSRCFDRTPGLSHARAGVNALREHTGWGRRCSRASVVLAAAAVAGAIAIPVLPAAASGGCPNEPFRTGRSASLPDCRV